MKQYTFSEWFNSSGGPFIVMEQEKASLWRGLDNTPSDYDLACQASNYTEVIFKYNTNILVLGDEPLQTAIATSDDRLLIIRWKWADSESDIQRAVDNIDFEILNSIEKLTINWRSQPLVMFDAVDKYDPTECLTFSTDTDTEVSTFIYQPNTKTALLVHSISNI